MRGQESTENLTTESAENTEKNAAHKDRNCSGGTPAAETMTAEQASHADNVAICRELLAIQRCAWDFQVGDVVLAEIETRGPFPENCYRSWHRAVILEPVKTDPPGVFVKFKSPKGGSCHTWCRFYKDTGYGEIQPVPRLCQRHHYTLRDIAYFEERLRCAEAAQGSYQFLYETRCLRALLESTISRELPEAIATSRRKS